MTETSSTPAATITADRASAVAEAAVAEAGPLGVPFAVVVVDAGGFPVATRQMAGASQAAVEASTAKAATAMLFARSTKALARTTLPGTQLSPPDGLADGHTAAFAPGGVPLGDADGQVIGAIGVCGGTPEQDHKVAKAGAAARA
jgi:uncharacterized protein GlcG (DUF336 family)